MPRTEIAYVRDSSITTYALTAANYDTYNATNRVVGTAFGTAHHEFAGLDDGLYIVLKQAGANPASTDVPIAEISALGNVPSAEEIGDRIERVGGPLNSLTGKFAGITLLSSWLRAMIRKDIASASAISEINTGGGTYDETTDSIQAIADNLPEVSLIGSNNVTVIVRDSDTEAAIQNAGVTISRPGYQQTIRTDADGELPIPFTVDDATWTIKVTAEGFVGQSHTQSIIADYSRTFDMVARGDLESSSYCDVKVRVINQSGNGVSGVRVFARIVDPLSFTASSATINTNGPQRTNGDGYTVFSLIRSHLLSGTGMYEFTVSYKNAEHKFQFLVPDAATANAVQAVH